MSRIKCAPMFSKAQVSLDRQKPPSIWPSDSGRRPFLSRTAYRLFSVRIKKANAPSSRRQAAVIFSSSVPRPALDHMQQDLAVGGALKDAAAAFQRVLQLGRVDDLAVVHCGKAADAAPRHQRLDVLDFAAAGRTVAHMPDRAAAGQGFQITRTECFGEQPPFPYGNGCPVHPPRRCRRPPARGAAAHAGRNRSAVLPADAENPKHPALLVQFLHASFLHPYLLLAFIRNAEKACRHPGRRFSAAGMRSRP